MNLYSNGKLLITGEYLVLNGAEALALPLSCGQSLNYKKTTNNLIKWVSYDLKNNIYELELNSNRPYFKIENGSLIQSVFPSINSSFKRSAYVFLRDNFLVIQLHLLHHFLDKK